MDELKVFISQPMHRKSEEEVFEIRKEIEDFLKTCVVDEPNIIDQYHQEPSGEGNERIYYLGNSIAKMKDADIVIFTEDYEESTGCKVEKLIVELYKIPSFLYRRIDDNSGRGGRLTSL